MAKTTFSLQNIRNFWKYTSKGEECWVWTGCADRNGYGLIRANGKLLRASRFSWQLHYSAIPDGLCVCHRCDNPSRVRPDHLFLGTVKENIADKVAKCRHPVGESAGASKLSATDVERIREMLEAGHSQYAIAREFGVTRSNIYCIKSGRSWRSA